MKKAFKPAIKITRAYVNSITATADLLGRGVYSKETGRTLRSGLTNSILDVKHMEEYFGNVENGTICCWEIPKKYQKPLEAIVSDLRKVSENNYNRLMLYNERDTLENSPEFKTLRKALGELNGFIGDKPRKYKYAIELSFDIDMDYIDTSKTDADARKRMYKHLVAIEDDVYKPSLPKRAIAAVKKAIRKNAPIVTC